MPINIMLAHMPTAAMFLNYYINALSRQLIVSPDLMMEILLL